MRTAICFLTLLPAWAADCTSAAAGNWSNPASWSGCGGAAPGIGDTATLGHLITVDATVTVGTSPEAGGFVIVINAPGRLVIAQDQTLTVRGGIQHVEPASLNARVEMQPGSKLYFDPSNAANRTTAVYTVRSSAANSEQSIIRMLCSSEKRCEVKTLRPNGDEARAYFAANGNNTGAIDARYVDFSDLGSTTDPSFTWVAGASGVTGFTTSFVFCSFNNIGYIGLASSTSGPAAATAIQRFNYNRVSNGLNSSDGFVVKFSLSAARTGVGVREVIGNYMPDLYIGGGSNSPNCRDFIFRANVVRGFRCSPLGSPPAVREWNLLLRQQEGNVGEAWFTVANEYIRNDRAWNPKNFVPAGAESNATNVIHDNVNGEDGDLFTKNSGPNVPHRVIDNIVPLESSSVENGSSLVTPLGCAPSSCGFWTVEKNTVAGAGNKRALLAYFESGVSANTIVSLRSNAIANVNGGTMYGSGLTAYRPAELAASEFNVVSPATTTHNGHFGFPVAVQPGNTNNGTVYFTKTNGVVPGANDVNESPDWVDPFRNIYKWMELKGGTGTTAGVKAFFDEQWNWSETKQIGLIQDLHNWVRQGFAPRNLKYATGGHDGGRIGAVDPVPMFGMFNGGNE